MPKSTDKKKSLKRPKTNSMNENEENQEPKKRKVLKKTKADGIDVSKQLSRKQKTPRSSQPRSTSKKNNEPRICGNGKPMPALAELELMYEDSDDDSDTQNPTPSTAAGARPTTPENTPLKISEDKLLSPRTLKQIASKVLAKIDTILESGTHDALIPTPPPIIPPKKRKKPDKPYIVGCKDRPQVPWAPAKNSFCVGDEKYGPEYNEPNSDSDECCSKKRCKRSSKSNISKSIFNAKSDEIAARLTELESNSPRDAGSPDSNKTVDYDYMNTLVPRPFSPLPSTSQDNETILKNEKLFNESLKCEQQFNSTLKNECNDSQNYLEVIETPCETINNDRYHIPIIYNFTSPNIKTEPKVEAETSIEDDDLCMIWPTNSSPIHQPINLDSPVQTLHTKDDSCVIVEPDIKTNRNISNSIETIEIKDEIYGSLDLTHNYDTDICEIIDLDVDDVIAESNAVLEKYKNKTIANVTTVVEPTCGTRETAAQNSNNNSNPPSRECSNTEENVQITSLALQEQPTTVTQTTSGHSSYITSISDVVHNFFKPNSTANNTSQTVDLTSSHASIPNPIHIASERIVDSMMSMLRFLGHSNSRTSTNSVQIVDDQSTSSNLFLTDNVSYENNINTNMSSSNSTDNINYMQYLTRTPPPNNRSKKSKKNTPKVTAKPSNPTTVLEEPDRNTTTRSLGDCPICMDNLSNTAVASTLCGHIFCLNCIKAAFKSNGKKCPTCRKALKGVGYHQIFI